MRLPALNCHALARVLAKSAGRESDLSARRRIFALKNFQERRDCAAIFQAMEPSGNVRRASCVATIFERIARWRVFSAAEVLGFGLTHRYRVDRFSAADFFRNLLVDFRVFPAF